MRSRNKCLTLMYDGPVGWWRNACDDASKILSIEKLQPGQLNERTRGAAEKNWESKTLARKSAPVSEVWFANTQTELHKYTKTNTFRQSPTVAREKGKKRGQWQKTMSYVSLVYCVIHQRGNHFWRCWYPKVSIPKNRSPKRFFSRLMD